VCIPCNYFERDGFDAVVSCFSRVGFSGTVGVVLMYSTGVVFMGSFGVVLKDSFGVVLMDSFGVVSVCVVV
jgi:hypothetical protein